MFPSRAFTAALTLAAAALWADAISAHSTERQPLTYVSRLDDPIIRTETDSRRVHAFSSFELSFLLHDRRQRVRLSLSPNNDIISKDAVLQIMGPDGKVRATEPINRMEHKIYQGHAFAQRPGHSEWTNVGWARINIRRDGLHPIFEGAFRIDGDDHHIQTDETYRKSKLRADPEIEWSPEEYMVVWKDSDISSSSSYDSDDGPSGGELKRDLSSRRSLLCSSDNLDFNADATHPIYQGLDTRDLGTGFTANGIPRELVRRQDQTQTGNGAGVNLASTIGSTNGCPTTRKVALLGVATDCTYSKQFNSTMAIRQNIISQVNTASQIYESSFNISLGIQNLTISDTNCPSKATEQAPWNVDCGGGVTITDRLNLFSAWRGGFKDRNAFWTLLTTCNTDAAVGLAWLGQLCVEGSQKPGNGNTNETIAGANVVVKTSQEWQVIAHEIGHTFGAVHDCQATTCQDGTSTKSQCCPFSQSGDCDAKGQFIMNPSTGSKITNFSPCTIGNICSAMGRNSVRSSCLASNKDVTTITGSQCGNGIVEAGEECDCGGPSGCKNNPCCNPTTCKLTTGSSCDPANEECCTGQCKFSSAGTVCRASIGSCDPAETCSGTSGACPVNLFAPNGQTCGDSSAGLACASGQCTSRNAQCKTLMGSLTTGNDTYACSNSGCQLSCASPEFGRDTCLTMVQNFLDGTPCQGGGKCSNGACSGSSFATEVGTWITENKNVIIPVAASVGGLILVALVCCCITAFARRKTARVRNEQRRAAALAAKQRSREKQQQRMGDAPRGPSPQGWASNGGAYAQAQRGMGGGEKRGDVHANIQPVPPAASRWNSRSPPEDVGWRPPAPSTYMSARYA